MRARSVTENIKRESALQWIFAFLNGIVKTIARSRAASTKRLSRLGMEIVLKFTAFRKVSVAETSP